jgi:hypothetical protein
MIDEDDALLMILYRRHHIELNDVWRCGTPAQQKALESLKNEMNAALAKFPKFQGPVFRHASTLDGGPTSLADIRALREKGEMTFKGITSAARNQGYLQDDMQIHYRIASESGRIVGDCLGNLRSGEVRFLDGTTLSVEGWQFRGDSSEADARPKVMIELREIPGP